MSNKSLGLIEAYGLLAGVEAADAAMKSANVQLVGYEMARGSGMTTIKVEGDVGAVKAAISAAEAAVKKIGRVASVKVIARPSQYLESMIRNDQTVGYAPEKTSPEPTTPSPDGGGGAKAEQAAPSVQAQTGQATQSAPAVKEQANASAPAKTEQANPPAAEVKEQAVPSVPAKEGQATGSVPAKAEPKKNASASKGAKKHAKQAAKAAPKAAKGGQPQADAKGKPAIEEKKEK